MTLRSLLAAPAAVAVFMTVAGPAGAATFGPPLPLPAGGFYMGLGDLNFDGKLDMVQTHFNSSASVYTGDGDGTFTTRTPLTVGNAANDAVIADFTTDNTKPDVAVINFDDRTVTMFVNTTATAGAAPTFEASTTHSTGAAGKARNTTAAANFDSSGGLDLAVPTFMDNQVSVLLGNGEGLLGAPFQFATTAAGGGEMAAAGNLNADFKPDLVVANFFTDNVSALLNTTGAPGTATFAPKQDAPAGDGARALAIGDLNGDTNGDVAVANELAQSVTVLIGNGDGTFDPAVPYAIGTGTSGVAIGDLDADGKNDIVVAKGNGAGVFKGNGNGTFQPIASLAGAASGDIDIADVNGDLQPDIVTDTQVFLNTTAPPVPPPPGTADLSVSLVADDPTPEPGEPFTYTATLTNRGPAAAVSPKVAVTLPSTVRYLSAAIAQAPGCSTSGSVVTCGYSTLANGGVARRRISVRPTRSGSLVATAVASSSTPDPSGATSSSSSQATLPKPKAGKDVNVKSVKGTVRIKQPGQRSFRNLDGEDRIRMGSIIDATRGRVRLTTSAGGGKTQTAEFYDGIFKVTQTKGKKPITDLALVGKLAGCKKSKRASAAAKKRRGRRLWGSGKGRFRTRGKRSSALVRGTIWLVEDRCNDTTFTQVRRGVVQVRDFGRKRNITVRAGRTYTARKRR